MSDYINSYDYNIDKENSNIKTKVHADLKIHQLIVRLGFHHNQRLDLYLFIIQHDIDVV